MHSPITFNTSPPKITTTVHHQPHSPHHLPPSPPPCTTNHNHLLQSPPSCTTNHMHNITSHNHHHHAPPPKITTTMHHQPQVNIPITTYNHYKPCIRAYHSQHNVHNTRCYISPHTLPNTLKLLDHVHNTVLTERFDFLTNKTHKKKHI